MDIHAQQLKLQAMASQCKLPLVLFAADGAAAKLLAQFLIDNEQSQEPALTYLYGIHLKVPVFTNTGPLISITDPAHAKKTARNQPQYDTHTASLGAGHLVNQSFIDLLHLFESGLVLWDIENVDKQDDGAARQIFHTNALKAMLNSEYPNRPSIQPGFESVFAYLFILGVSLFSRVYTPFFGYNLRPSGTLFEAWMNPNMKTEYYVLAALQACFWLHLWYHHILHLSGILPNLYSIAWFFISPASFQILNCLCNTLVLLVLTFSCYYTSILFCIWLFRTEFVEHFFGIA
jgi:hypothetical protein